jgi:hypothetical protein
MPPAASGQLIEVARPLLLKRLRQAKREVVLVAPFLTMEVADALGQSATTSSATRLRLLTALTKRSVIAGVLDPAALALLTDYGFEVRSIRNLHAKLTLVDEGWGLLGSGNLTTRGLGGGPNGNVELGVVLSPPQIRQARAVAARWWRQAAPVTTAELAAYSKLPRAPGVPGAGMGVGPVLPVDADDLLVRKRRGSTGWWLKMLYHDTRAGQPDWWRRVSWVSDGRPPANPLKPTGGPRYQSGDLLVFYLVERDGPVRCCPAIAEVQAIARYDPEFVRTNAAAGEHLQWPWVTPVRVRHATTLAKAPLLRQLPVRPESVRRHGHLVLSRDQYLNARRLMA